MLTAVNETQTLETMIDCIEYVSGKAGPARRRFDKLHADKG